MTELAELWTAAGSWLIPRLQNTVIDDINLDNASLEVLKEVITYAYKDKKVTMLQRKVISVLYYLSTVKNVAGWTASLPHRALADFTDLLLEHRKSMTVDLGWLADHKSVFHVKEEEV